MSSFFLSELMDWAEKEFVLMIFAENTENTYQFIDLSETNFGFVAIWGDTREMSIKKSIAVWPILALETRFKSKDPC